MKGILFDMETGMLEAVISGKKTMTRRLGGLKKVNVNPDEWSFLGMGDTMEIDPSIATFYNLKKNEVTYTHCKPRYNIGETIFVKESHFRVGYSIGNIPPVPDKYWYKLNHKGEKPKEFNWSNAMFCGQKQARHFLKITNVRVQRLNDISDKDCLLEGIKIIQQEEEMTWYQDYSRGFYKSCELTPRESFASLINRINGKNTWSKNPFVFVYEFEKTTNTKQ